MNTMDNVSETQSNNERFEEIYRQLDELEVDGLIHGNYSSDSSEPVRQEKKEGDEKYDFYDDEKISEVRDRIILSDEQMILAAAEGERYSILNVVYDRLIKNGTDITELKNPVSLIGERKLINLRKGYLFHLNQAA